MKKYCVHYVKFGYGYYRIIEAENERDAARKFHDTVNKWNECTITKINLA